MMSVTNGLKLKLNWKCSNVRSYLQNFLKQPSTTHYHIGLKIFNQLVTEMNQASPGKGDVETNDSNG